MRWMASNFGMIGAALIILAGFASVETELHTLTTRLDSRARIEVQMAELMPKTAITPMKPKTVVSRGTIRVQKIASR